YYHSEDTLSVILGNGDGTFNLPVKYAAGQVAVVAAAGDLNHDGYPDLVVADSDGTVSVLLNDGSWMAPLPPIRLTDNADPARLETPPIPRPSEMPRTNTIFDEGITQSNAAGTPFLPARRAPTSAAWIDEALTMIFVEDSMP